MLNTGPLFPGSHKYKQDLFIPYPIHDPIPGRPIPFSILFPELSVPFPFTRTDGNDNFSIRFLPDPYTCVSSLGFMEGAPQTPNKAS